MMRRVGVLPALVTMANGYCGILSIYKTADGHFYAASWLIMLAMFFDMIDGRIARMAGATTRFGAYLDSLSDMISFGVAPAFLVKEIAPAEFHGKALAFMTALFALGALLRLARYNDEHASSEGLDKDEGAISRFDGLPTPGAAGVIASLVFLAHDPEARFDYDRLMIAMPFLCVVLGCLMVSRVPYFHFGQRFLRGRRDFSYLFRVVVLAMAFSFFPHEMAAVGFVTYAIVGPFLRPLRRTRQDDLDDEEDGAA